MTLKNNFKQSLDYPFKSVIKFKNSAQILLVGIKKKIVTKSSYYTKIITFQIKMLKKKNL